ncbi:winged helix-turn-helix domain-containing protein [Edaphobacter aggregans]|uniref:ArsR family transcriptional regulator n=1 Tax=Edaphobacter aggregans TaxID=570835 RepID=UPI0009FC6F15
MLEQIATLGASIACQRLLHLHDISPATLSHHLKELETAGLIKIARHGRDATLIFQPYTFRAYLNELTYLYSIVLDVSPSDEPRRS